MKRIVSLLLVFLMIVSVAACGSNNTAGENNGTAATASTAAATGTPAATNTQSANLKLVFWGTDTEKKNVEEEVVPQFEAANPGLKVTSQHINSGDNAAIATMLASGDQPDVSWIDPSYIPGWASAGVLYNIYDLMANDSKPSVKKEDYVDYAFLEYEQGKAFGTLLSVEPLVLYYNPSVFKEAGVANPPATPDTAWTWDEFLQNAKLLTKDKNGNNATSSNFDSKNIVRYGIMFDSWHFQFDGVLNSFGGSWLDKDGKFNLTDPKSIQALQFMGDLVNKYHVAPSPLQFKNMPAMDVSLLGGQTAMVLDGAWEMLTFNEQGKPGQYDMAAFPRVSKEVKSPTTVGLMALTAFKTKNPSDATWQLFKWLNSTEGALSQYTKGCWLPLIKSYYTDPAKLDLWTKNDVHTANFKNAVLQPTLENAIITPNFNIKNFTDINAVVGPALSKVYNGEATAKDAIDQVKDAASALTQGYYFTQK